MSKRQAKSAPVVTQQAFAWQAVGLHAGVDEAGRGPLAGPVVAAAVILDEHQPILGLNDSKKLSSNARDRLYMEIMGKALCCATGWASVEEIDRLNILQATFLAMQRAVEGLRLRPVHVWIDGNQLPQLPMTAEAVVGGDALVPSISAASILAKVTRDRYMIEMDAQYPHHGFAGHKGYGTASHLQALQMHGATPLHRRSFKPVDELDARFRRAIIQQSSESKVG